MGKIIVDLQELLGLLQGKAVAARSVVGSGELRFGGAGILFEDLENLQTGDCRHRWEPVSQGIAGHTLQCKLCKEVFELP